MKLNAAVVYAALSASTLLWMPSRIAPAQEQEVIAAGEIEYQHHCASCHGVDGKGSGPMAKFLTIEPSDLTQLTKRNLKFPFWQVYRTIDGRQGVRGHGTREMPVWGSRFQAQASGGDRTARSEVAGRILSLVFYLEHIQAE
jgi:hypothetical protein